MTKHLLLPNKFRLLGYVLLPFSLAWLIAGYGFDQSVFPFLEYSRGEKTSVGIFGSGGDFLFSPSFTANFNGELSMMLTFISLFMIAFAKEKVEDEYVRMVRLKALQISVYANYIVLAVASMLIYGLSFLYVMELNLFTILVLFILIYNYHLNIKPRFAKN